MSAVLQGPANASLQKCHPFHPVSKSAQFRQFRDGEFYHQDTVNCVNFSNLIE